MKASRYNLLVESPKDHGTFLYNTLYGSLALLDSDGLQSVGRVLQDPDQVAVSDAKYLSALRQNKFIVDDALDEIAIVENRKRLGMGDQNRFDVVIMPTLQCNFACVYCYEDHRSSLMSDETAAGIMKWLEHEIPQHKVTLLHWYGGEPLLCFERIVSLSQFASAVASASGAVCVTHMTTNGYLFNETRIDQLVAAGIRDYQITMDGPAETHDTLRVLKDGTGTFQHIFRNVCALAMAHPQIKITLRVNFNHTNLGEIPRLLELFPKEVRSHLRVVYEPIFGNCSLSATDNLAPVHISESTSKYYQLARELGYDIVLGMSNTRAGKLVYCYAERENQFIVNYNGDVYKCSVSKFAPEDRVGFISPDGVFVKDELQWQKWSGIETFDELCRACIYLPLCMGGCRKTRLAHRGTGSFCALIPTNASQILKNIAFDGLDAVLHQARTDA